MVHRKFWEENMMNQINFHQTLDFPSAGLLGIAIITVQLESIDF